jgi:Fe-S protein assembly co-chaperone HscB
MNHPAIIRATNKNTKNKQTKNWTTMMYFRSTPAAARSFRRLIDQARPLAPRCSLSTAAAAPDTDTESEELLDLFRVLELPRRFAISEADLKANYRKLMIEFHPDKHSGKSKQEREYADMKASQVTHSFQELKNPHTRAVHLLHLLGNPMDETSKGNLVGNEFLMDVMEIRESVASTPATNLEPIWRETRLKIQQVCEELGAAFEQEDTEKALKISAMLQYWHRIEETIHEKMEVEE